MCYRSAWLPATVAVGGLLCAGPAAAEEKKAVDLPRTVNDEAGLFGEDARTKANTEIAEIKKRFRKDPLIETLKEVPNAKTADLSTPSARNKFA